MTDFRALCAELVAALKEWTEYEQPCTKEDETDLAQARRLVQRAYALLAQPESQGPTVMQILALSDEIEAEELGTIDLVRRALARWGRPAIGPVSVSERLPGPEDCDTEGRCWFGTPSGYATGAIWTHRKAEQRRSWDTHWLPHWALQVPGVEAADG
jgi:hypothetical protein